MSQATVGNQNFIINATPEEIAEWLIKNFYYQVPDEIRTAEEMVEAGTLMSRITNAYSYLTSLGSWLSIQVMKAKQECITKPVDSDLIELEKYERAKKAYQNIMEKRKIVDAYADILNKSYTCVSRMVTIKLKADEELHMSDVPRA